MTKLIMFFTAVLIVFFLTYQSLEDESSTLSRYVKFYGDKIFDITENKKQFVSKTKDTAGVRLVNNKGG